MTEAAADAHDGHGQDDIHGHGDDHHGGPDHHPHVLPYKTYFLVWSALLVLTVVTVGVSYVDFGGANLVIALVVATIKASLVGAIFMHLKYETKFYTVVFVSSLVFVSIFIGITGLDYLQRGRADHVRHDRVMNMLHPFDPAPPKAAPKPAAHHHE